MIMTNKFCAEIPSLRFFPFVFSSVILLTVGEKKTKRKSYTSECEIGYLNFGKEIVRAFYSCSLLSFEGGAIVICGQIVAKDLLFFCLFTRHHFLYDITETTIKNTRKLELGNLKLC